MLKALSAISDLKPNTKASHASDYTARYKYAASQKGYHNKATINTMENLATVARSVRSAITSSVQPADHSKRGLNEIPDGETPTFIPPPRKGPLRVRRAAHHDDAEYLKKYEKAIELMKALLADDPRNFTRQVDLYHAYRNGTYHQTGLPKLDFQEPNSRFFFPWHRCYLYFYERILGNLIGDDEFSIPYWKMDHPERTVVPDFYNKNRDPNNQRPIIVDHDSNQNSSERMEDNLKYLYRSITLIGKNAEHFMGSPNWEGDETNYPGDGSRGQIPHWPAHVWIEEPAKSNVNAMGSFYLADRDLSFLGCCANVDQMWSAREAQGGVHRRDYGDPDWLDAYFYFYDENRQIVRMKVKDSLDTGKLGYEYDNVEIN